MYYIYIYRYLCKLNMDFRRLEMFQFLIRRYTHTHTSDTYCLYYNTECKVFAICLLFIFSVLNSESHMMSYESCVSISLCKNNDDLQLIKMNEPLDYSHLNEMYTFGRGGEGWRLNKLLKSILADICYNFILSLFSSFVRAVLMINLLLFRSFASENFKKTKWWKIQWFLR